MLGKMSTVSGLLTSPVIVGLLVDWQFGTSPWCVLGGLAFGFAACMAYLVQQAKRDEIRRLALSDLHRAARVVRGSRRAGLGGWPLADSGNRDSGGRPARRVTLGLLACMRHRPPAEVIGLLLVEPLSGWVGIRGGLHRLRRVSDGPREAAARRRVGARNVSGVTGFGTGVRVPALAVRAPARPTGSGSP